MSKKMDAKAAGMARTASIRCAVYTRKSSEEGLSMEFNSLDAQRESGEAYVASMKHEGWVCLPEKYDDGGFTGGNMDRPGLQRLMADIEAGKIDCVIVYKVDRLSRSLLDFARLMELFERKKISFVSVTQQFNTTQSMGRLTLNILLSFAQFEREIISERTRDKIAASRRKGKWAGGRCVLGYDVDPVTKKLVVNTAEAEVVKDIFNLYLAGKSLLDVAKELNGRGLTTKVAKSRGGTPYGGKAWDKSAVHKTLTNPLYAGRVRHKDQLHPGEHQRLVGEAEWGTVQARLKKNGRTGGPAGLHKHSALLRGLLYCGPCGVQMGHTCSVKGANRIYKYYTCYVAQKQGWEACPCKSLPAHQIERFVVGQVARVVNDPAMRSLALAKGRRQAETARDVAQAELEVVERDLARLHADLRATVGDGAGVGAVGGNDGTDRHAGQRMADLHERIEAGGRRVRELRETIEIASATMLSKEHVDAALADFTGLWSKLSPKEQHELVRLLVQRIDYDATKGSVSITFHQTGLRMIGQSTKEHAA